MGTKLNRDSHHLIRFRADIARSRKTKEIVVKWWLSPFSSGTVTLLLEKDNPSGLPKHDASLSFPLVQPLTTTTHTGSGKAFTSGGNF